MGVCLGKCLPGGVSARGVVSAWEVYTPCGQTDTCENITFPQLLLWTLIKTKLAAKGLMKNLLWFLKCFFF